MKISFEEIKAIADTLPIGLYAKRRVPITLDEKENTSFYDDITDTIVISYPQLAESFDKVKEDGSRETTIRSMLYHEVSHAILTNARILWYGVTDQMNIFEDERIETLLNTYYLDTDFAEQVYRINGIESNADLSAPQNGMDAFYQVVRFHHGKQEFLDKAEALIKKYAHLNKANNSYEWHRYEEEVNEFYEEVAKDYEENKNNDGNDESDSCGGCGGSGGNYKQDVKHNENDPQNGKGDGKPTNDKGESSNGDKKKAFNVSDVQIDGESLGQALAGVFTQGFAPKYDDEMYKKFEAIINNFNKKNNSGSSFSGYSGVFNPRSAGRTDYRYFDRKASVNGTNKFGTFHLNLFLDNSGSFSNNKNIVNAMLGALIRLEKTNKNFSFNVVHCGYGEKLITDKRKYGLTCDDGTSLDYEAIDIYRKLQKPNTYNYNIVLYDGSCYNRNYSDAFKAFNHSNCTIISDPDNEKWMAKYAPSAKQIITRHYTSELLDNILATISRAFR